MAPLLLPLISANILPPSLPFFCSFSVFIFLHLSLSLSLSHCYVLFLLMILTQFLSSVLFLFFTSQHDFLPFIYGIFTSNSITVSFLSFLIFLLSSSFFKL